ncbi:hypothetical protein BDN70DRAFT_924964 [Pholiota conissans]|uniref:Uncharacterized protein n=1 Tax=Pholiota conissans TaxID=109636 RepID=A0A9P6CV53_9AGAR|nr:hypothetical protein BDN70DRAFT_924964 [Pholiota conissans]
MDYTESTGEDTNDNGRIYTFLVTRTPPSEPNSSPQHLDDPYRSTTIFYCSYSTLSLFFRLTAATRNTTLFTPTPRPPGYMLARTMPNIRVEGLRSEVLLVAGCWTNEKYLSPTALHRYRPYEFRPRGALISLDVGLLLLLLLFFVPNMATPRNLDANPTFLPPKKVEFGGKTSNIEG